MAPYESCFLHLVLGFAVLIDSSTQVCAIQWVHKCLHCKSMKQLFHSRAKAESMPHHHHQATTPGVPWWARNPNSDDAGHGEVFNAAGSCWSDWTFPRLREIALRSRQGFWTVSTVRAGLLHHSKAGPASMYSSFRLVTQNGEDPRLTWEKNKEME